jgi:multidrug efflux system membrane fusion protein
MRALFPNPEHELLPGAYVTIALDRAIQRQAILIPRDALLRTADGVAVKVVDADGKVRDVDVSVDGMSGRHWSVTRGLAGGERVIINNATQFASGTVVKVVEPARPSEAAASET